MRRASTSATAHSPSAETAIDRGAARAAIGMLAARAGAGAPVVTTSTAPARPASTRVPSPLTASAYGVPGSVTDHAGVRVPSVTAVTRGPAAA